MTTTIILNPYANRWKARECKNEIEALLDSARVDFILHETEYPGHGLELARKAVEDGNLPLIAVGGDGTVSEVVNGLFQATARENYPVGPVGIIPAGTANDLTDVLGIPRNVNEAMRVIMDGHTRVIDVGIVNGHYFDNNSAIGLEPMVTMENIRLTWLQGVMRYLIAAVISILKFSTVH
jgi:diacylglycerol kinase (ATP)